MPISKYIKTIATKYAAGNATEHTYRPALEAMLSQLLPDLSVVNEPKRQACGAPDYILQRKEVPIGYIEAKDIGIDLDKTERGEQISRYKVPLQNLILTDYLEFRFFRDGNRTDVIKIAEVTNNKIVPIHDSHERVIRRLKTFGEHVGQTISSAERLAKLMADKARLMEHVFDKAVRVDDESNTLRDQLQAFRNVLIDDLNERKFADIYAQTIAYGLFAARLHDDTLDDFSRYEAQRLIPATNPFLRNLFNYISGPDLDKGVEWIVNDLADIFRAVDLKSILEDFGKATGQTDPFLHFYETFLAEYDSKLRKSRGVYYTPEPVVNFIVRAVDDILQKEFGLPMGLADTSKVKIEVEGHVSDGRYKGKVRRYPRDVHKVQILDPATGTGTFLAEVVKQIYSKFEGQEGMWPQYVKDHLLPRLHGFEILMAPYTMCHLKLEMLLRETGYKAEEQEKSQRLKVYLTNALEEAHPHTGGLFASWLANEANEANFVKRDTPVMVVLGNPPYAVSSSNKGEWIQGLIEDYKKDLNERKINLDDDYIKFIRYAQYYIEKNGEGVLAFISNNSFIDGVTHRQMRKSLYGTFDLIYIVDLHGNANKQEKTKTGTTDKNVFDIQQGVSISLLVKHKRSTEKSIYHYDCYGDRREKYAFLSENSIGSIDWKKIKPSTDYCFFCDKNLTSTDVPFFSVKDIFTVFNSGIQTKRDKVNIHFTERDAEQVLNDFREIDIESLRAKYDLPPDGRDWTIPLAKKDALGKVILHKEQYRPFDYRYSFYTGNSKGLVAYPRQVISQHIIGKENIGICLMRQFFQDAPYSHVLVSTKMIDERTMYSNRGGTYFFPLFLYPDEELTLIDSASNNSEPNLNNDIVDQFALRIGVPFCKTRFDDNSLFDPVDMLDYIYAILHSHKYRETYKEFLKIEFPRIPYPKDRDYFWKMVDLGKQIRKTHLFEFPVVSKAITKYPVAGSNLVEKPQYKNGKVWINKDQYFEGVPEVAWTFYVGGYQPAQKWLKDRKGRELSVEDIMHYQKIIVALTETDRLMKEVDKVIEI